MTHIDPIWEGAFNGISQNLAGKRPLSTELPFRTQAFCGGCHPSLGAGELPLRTVRKQCARGDVARANSASGEWSSRHVPMQASI